MWNDDGLRFLVIRIQTRTHRKIHTYMQVQHTHSHKHTIYSISDQITQHTQTTEHGVIRRMDTSNNSFCEHAFIKIRAHAHRKYFWHRHNLIKQFLNRLETRTETTPSDEPTFRFRNPNTNSTRIEWFAEKSCSHSCRMLRYPVMPCSIEIFAETFVAYKLSSMIYMFGIFEYNFWI